MLEAEEHTGKGRFMNLFGWLDISHVLFIRGTKKEEQGYEPLA